jgi:hypothetical protein
MLGHLAVVIARNRALDSGLHDLADWQIELLEGHGYYSERAADNAEPLIQFVEEFVRGRGLIYDEISVKWHGETAVVESKMWFSEELPEVFFYFDISLEEFAAYAKALAEAHARACGFMARIEHVEGIERAQISLLQP